MIRCIKRSFDTKALHMSSVKSEGGENSKQASGVKTLAGVFYKCWLVEVYFSSAAAETATGNSIRRLYATDCLGG